MNTETDKPNPEEIDLDPNSADESPQIEAASEEQLNALDAAMESKSNDEPTIEGLQAQLADAEKRVLMAHADLDNFRRRTRRDQQDTLKYASLPLMGQILEALDNFDRAIEAHEKDPSGAGLLDGVKMVAQQISEALAEKGCKKIEAVGQPFDPNKHQAMQMQPSDEYDANIVMMDLRPGFELHDRVIRPSQVFVSTGPATQQNGNEE
jgi:molecular chaperone GrpE